MERYRCPKCGAIFEGNPRNCPRCNVMFRFRDDDPKAALYVPKSSLVAKEEEKKEPEVVEKIVEVPVEVEKVVEVPVEVEKIVEKPVAFIPAKNSENTYFDGKTGQYFGLALLGALLTTVTLGILYPLAWAWLKKWEINHTVVNGYRLKFDGKVGSLIGRWILWELLIVVTLTIFAWFVPVRLNKWATARTTVVFDKPVEKEKKEEPKQIEDKKEEAPALEAPKEEKAEEAAPQEEPAPKEAKVEEVK